jgi:predicted nucleic acid-binding protein
VSKYANGDPDVGALIKRAEQRDARVVIPIATLVETLRGEARDAAVHRILKRVTLVPLDKDLGRLAGELLGGSKLPNRSAVDAMVAATALSQEPPVVILTSDPKDLSALVEGHKAVGVIQI